MNARDGDFRRLRVLVADDDRDTVATTLFILRDEGFEAYGVHDGGKVLPAVKDLTPDVVVLDIVLSGLSGWELVRLIRSQPDPRPQVLIGISGVYQQSDDRAHARVAGFDHYLLKPFDPQALIALLRPLRRLALRD